MSRMPASAGLNARQMLELSLYDYIGTLLERLIPRFDLQGSVERIRRSYQLICRESLAIPCGFRSLNFSRINQDGTPFQFSSCLGDFKPPLQFLSEAGVPGSAARDRQLLSKGRIAALASLFGAETPLFEVTELLDDMAFGNHPELLLESGGPLWIGVSFSPREEPKLKIYMNGKWGAEATRWTRLRRFASYFGAAERWLELEKLVFNKMEPLGIALTLSRDHPPAGRIYLSAFGRPLSYYESLARSAGSESFEGLLRQFASVLLGEECRYPLQTTVCSFGFAGGQLPDFKFEICAHRVFACDPEARSRFLEWLEHQKLSVAAYENIFEVLSEWHVSEDDPQLHSYFGLGMKGERICSTCYFKPSAGLA